VGRKKIYVTREFPGDGLAMLSKNCDVTVNRSSKPPSRRQILKNVAGKDGILCMLSDRMDREVMDAAGPQLRVISSYSTGFDHIDVKEATARGIFVTFTSEILAEATADLTFSLVLACARNLTEGDKMVRAGKWNVGWKPDLLLGTDVHGATLGIIGLGRIGSAVARRAKGFGMNVLYHNRKSDLEKERELGVKYADIERLLSQSDFVSIHVSLNDQSKELVDISVLKKMKPTAFLINTSRGQVINEKDLIMALRRKVIAGAGLDVFQNEPLSKTSPLAKMRNVVLLPHLGSATIQTRSRMGEAAAMNLLDVLAGRVPDKAFLVNQEVAKFVQG
jgi:glyoxylate reductase